MSTCHPDRPHWALGLCLACYFRRYRAARKALGRPIVDRRDRREYWRARRGAA